MGRCTFGRRGGHEQAALPASRCGSAASALVLGMHIENLLLMHHSRVFASDLELGFHDSGLARNTCVIEEGYRGT